ncbi:hypothetical protein WJX84_012421 [Apatococcus fuscideae]|uniref:Uncharacterized protein n=1 Tax=Apatococcus fuscideae TaxID=2026836 RepID=A0AAW1S9T2_9CHLO
MVLGKTLDKHGHLNKAHDVRNDLPAGYPRDTNPGNRSKDPNKDPSPSGQEKEVRVKEPYKEPVTGKSGVGAEEHGMNTVHPEAKGRKGFTDGEPGTMYDEVVEGQLGGGEKKIAGQTLDKHS